MLIRDAAPLPRMEPFVGEMIAQSLTEAGVKVRTGVDVTGVDRPMPGGPVDVLLGDGQRIEADEVLFATGRKPRTNDLGLETVGLQPGRYLDVDDTCRVQGADGDGDWLYAVGDVKPPRPAYAPGQVPGTHRGCGDRRERAWLTAGHDTFGARMSRPRISGPFRRSCSPIPRSRPWA